ncbi:anoctamin family protein [Aspergillus alliaceus]|uniref:anoctamin family protein n=1 Tax=Petromyces alliaceus TaxID=209559 RepID=UPI0012A40234|nr:calcium-activated chloride channel-domain-containing protein [Aspergillus alliaceus]KAB8237131.1 calcium-activated chloride channel-domain-containing protein [Aspergillus alliaceus]
MNLLLLLLAQHPSVDMGLLTGSRELDRAEANNFGVDWVIHYQFEDTELGNAIEEFRTLIHDLQEAKLQVQVRRGYGPSLLLCIRVPRNHLGNMVYKSRVKDWLYGIIHEVPIGDEHTAIDSETAAEELRSVYHAVTWSKALGGAGITAQLGKWKNVASTFPLHDPSANADLLRKWSRTLLLNAEDLDAIRALYGEKVAYYFAFIQCYSTFLVFPAVWGVFSWLYLGPYSIASAFVNCLWSIVFVEYWKIRETDLSLRWNVKGVGVLKVNRPKYVWDKEVRDSVTGEIVRVFPAHKQFMRQMLLLPFATIASIALGSLIVVTFVMEIFISEVYTGPFKDYLEFLPTVLFSLSLPWINNKLTDMATQLTEYENYRTQDQYDIAQTTKTFVMNFITSFLPTILTAFVYVPFGARLLPYLDMFRVGSLAKSIDTRRVHIDPSRLQQEVIYLSVTGQILNFGEEVVLPYVKRVLVQKWRDYRKSHPTGGRRYSYRTDQLLNDAPDEASFLGRIRNEAEADEYNVHDDTLEMCVQYGYLALFGTSWPLVPLGFLANNWLELRGDFFKLSLECQRPPPIRADSIGPSLQGLEVLTWLGTLSTAAIVYLYRGGMADVCLSSLLLTLLAAEWAYLGLQFVVRTALEKIATGSLRREAAKRYAMRKSYLDDISRSTSPKGRQRVRFQDRVNVYSTATDVPTKAQESLHPGHHESTSEERFWACPPQDTADAGVRLIKALKAGDSVQPEKMKKGV